MAESDTTSFLRNEPNSTLFGISIRALITLIVVLTVCGAYFVIATGVVVHAILTKDWSLVGTFSKVDEPLYTLVGLTVGFYFGQKSTVK